MTVLSAHRLLVVVWAGLVAATALSFWLGDDHGLGTGDATVLALLGVTFAKVWLVGRQFMELRTAPPLLRGLFDGYVVVVPAALAALYLAA